MKPLEQLINVEKARLLYCLFPSEIPPFLQFMANMSATIEEEQANIKKQWEYQLFDFYFWLSLVQRATNYLNHDSAIHNSSLFATAFQGDAALYLIYCLLQYTQVRKHPNTKFSLAVALLFAA